MILTHESLSLIFLQYCFNHFAKMEKWIHENLSEIFDFPVSTEFAKVIMKMENERDLDDYLLSLLDYTNGKHRQFISELKKRQALSKDQSKYKKENDVDNGKRKQNEKKKGKVKGKESKENKQTQEVIKIDKSEKKKPKFVNISSESGILLKGRYKCNCETKEHPLINNCLNCGRIVCAQEGAGPCFFCKELVCSQEEQTILSSNTKQGDQLYNKLINQKTNKNLEESIKQRDKLLDYDRNGIQCTKVIDDECDYYQSNSTWLTDKQREKSKKLEEEIHERKHMSRLNRKIYATIDFTGREVIEENTTENFEKFSEEYLQDISESFSEIESNNICPHIEFNRPMYIESNELQPRTKAITFNTRNIIQDKEYLEMSDPGLCLSMHQPYASLLVAGIKVHEGRTWYSSHRGRLWIAATSKIPTKEEISNVEQCYRLLKNEKLMFPEIYSTGCLLGCVTVVDVLTQEEYKKSYPDGENDSPYVFICENFFMLPIKFPIQGKHKIYKLDPKIHHAALKMLDKCMKNTH